MPKLILMSNRGITKQVALSGSETRIGRTVDNDIVIDENQVSRSHAVLTVDGPFVSIKDVGSRNGVFVNGTKVNAQILMNGDTIAIGDSQIRFLAGDQDFTDVEALRLMTIPGLLVDLQQRAKL